PGWAAIGRAVRITGASQFGSVPLVSPDASRLSDLGDAVLHVSPQDAWVLDCARRCASPALAGLSPHSPLARVFGEACGAGDAELACVAVLVDRSSGLLRDRARAVERFHRPPGRRRAVRSLVRPRIPRLSAVPGAGLARRQ